MMKEMTLATVCFLLMAVMQSTALSGGEPDGQVSHPVSPLAGPVNDFSVAFMHRLLRANANTNVFASPFSVSTALSMLSMGARTSTEQQLRKGLKFDQLSSNELDNKTVHNLFQEVMSNRFKDDPSLLLANYILVQRELTASPVLQDFRNNLQSLYSAKVDDVDFATNGPLIQTDVNNWVNEATRGLIKSALSQPPTPDTLMILMNAIYFRGLWKKPFDKQNTRKISFFNRGENTSQEVDFMTEWGARVPYAELEMADQKIQALELEYNDNSTSMIILLPEKKDGLKQIVAHNSFETELKMTLNQTKSMRNQKVNLNIPKFKIDIEYNLNALLADMDMTNMFTGDADFSGITGSRSLRVSKVQHIAAVKVDEEGTEAAAVTTVVMVPMSAMIGPETNFVADHPFLLLIKDKTTGLILFIGKVEEF